MNTARLLRLVERQGAYVYIRPLSANFPGVEGEGLVWHVKVEQRGVGLPQGWKITERYGDDLETLVDEVVDEVMPRVRRRPRRRKR